MESYIDARIHSVKDVRFSMHDAGEVDLDKIQVQLNGGRFIIDDGEKTITFETTVLFLSEIRGDKNFSILEYTNQVGFYVENINEIVHADGDYPLLDKDIIKFFLDIILHTIRGILSVKTRGTSLEKAYLPLYKAENLIN